MLRLKLYLYGYQIVARSALIFILHIVPAAAAADTRDVTVGRGEVHLHLPVSWIQNVVQSEQDGSVLLVARWPNLTGYHDEHEHDHPWDKPTHDGVVEVLLTLSNHINPLQERYDRTVRFFAPLSRHPTTMNLEHWGKDSPPSGDFKTTNEVYFFNEETLDNYITCYLPDTVLSPGCKAEFYIGPFLAHASYSRTFLPEWRAIEDGLREHILSFVLPTPG